MDEESFTEWYNSAPAEYFKKYLKDSIEEKVEEAKDTIKCGGLLSEAEQVHIAVECATLERIVEITYTEIKDYYDTSGEE